MVAKGISQDDFPENVQQVISDEDHDCFGRFSNTFASEGSPIFFTDTFGSVFSKTISFVLKIMFSHAWLRQV